jgi:predicted RNA-binding Zn ribbon-like protein
MSGLAVTASDPVGVSTAAGLELVGCRPALDLVNTVSVINTGEGDRLVRPTDLIAWAVHSGILDTAEATMAWVERHPRDAAREFAAAVAMRAALWRVLRDQIEDRNTSAEDLDTIAKALRTSHASLETVEGHVMWVWTGPSSLERITWSAASDGVALLQSDAVDRLHQCGGPTCTWMFVDTSRSGRRKWCSMRDCGNRAKVRAYRQRHRDEPSHSPARTTP